MSKVTLKVEIDEETYKQIKGDSVCSNNNKIIISKSSSAYYALNAMINATLLTECDDAISREEALAPYRFNPFNLISFATVTLRLLKLPSVTPKRKKGEWIEHPHECGENWEFSKYECSICHTWEENDSDFCPNCGAEMR